MSDLVIAHNCCMARMLPGEAELVSERTCLSGRAQIVKRFERTNGPDIALYKNYLYTVTSHSSLPSTLPPSDYPASPRIFPV